METYAMTGPDDDEPASYMPGMTPGPEDEAWNKAMGSLTNTQIEKLADSLMDLYEKTKAREKVERAASGQAEKDDDDTFQAFRDRTGL
jgi:hypothetical protein